MGLDMYLYAHRKVTCPHCGEVIHGVSEGEEVAYWRKANQIHKWFSDHCAGGELENCEEYLVTKEQLQELLSTCKKVMAVSKIVQGKVKNGTHLNKETNRWEPIYEDGKTIKDPSIAQEILPTEDGFFFGSTEYDQYYLEDVKSTIEQVEKILEETDFDEYEILYHAWW